MSTAPPTAVDLAPIQHRTVVAVTVGSLHLLVGILALTSGLGGITLGMLLFAYSRGLLHALDADHLSMIDNSTRRLMRHQQPSAAVGLAFSLGHSTVVLTAGAAVIVGAGWIAKVLDGNSTATILGVIGGTVSMVYLFGVAASNLSLLRPTHAHPHPHEHRPLGPVAQMLAAPLGQVTRPWQVFVVGILFGLGFDTASTISIVMLTAATAGAHPVALAAIPVAFTAAMTLGDSINASLMLHAYRAAQPHSRLNRWIVGFSIAAAVLVASVTGAGLWDELTGGSGAWAELDTRLVSIALVTVAVSGGLAAWWWSHTSRDTAAVH